MSWGWWVGGYLLMAVAAAVTAYEPKSAYRHSVAVALVLGFLWPVWVLVRLLRRLA